MVNDYKFIYFKELGPISLQTPQRKKWFIKKTCDWCCEMRWSGSVYVAGYARRRSTCWRKERKRIRIKMDKEVFGTTDSFRSLLSYSKKTMLHL
ncbi:hypothetical protein ILUMI_18617 [Ignelater luminosus]|uniref:Uncharacterized protein n=1 Tax=Ignelater luminosus TaxID=2038154 RepID=A0A8K0CKY8_IGNLU|nr:hypothetical protein ILUMI_18617 [Ignelater luminosus]